MEITPLNIIALAVSVAALILSIVVLVRYR